MKLVALLDHYLEDRDFLDSVQKIKKGRDEIRPEILSFLDEFLAARREVEEWKEKIQLINTRWSIGRAIPVILGVYNECKEMGRLGQLEAFIRRHIAPPCLLDLRRMEPLVDFVKSNYRSNQRLRLLFTLSVFWHIQEPDTYPIFYPKSRDSMEYLRKEGYLSPLPYKIEDCYEQYLDFILVSREIKGCMEAKSIPSYQVEHFLLWMAEKRKK